jgi:hypothetical protein
MLGAPWQPGQLLMYGLRPAMRWLKCVELSDVKPSFFAVQKTVCP